MMKALLVTILLWTSAACAASASTSVLLLLADDQGAHLGCLGTQGIQTPHLDGLARQGVLFRRAYATCASCSPSRSAILTGRVPHVNGHWRNTHTPAIPGTDEDYGRASRFARIESVGLHEDIPTLVEILNDAGYVTGITEKFHLSPPWKYAFAHRLPARSRPETHARAAKEFLQACGDQPFFLMANIGNTHRPFARQIRGVAVPPVDPNAIAVPANLPDTSLLRRDLAQYLTAVQGVDACAGAIMTVLQEADRLEDTLIIFTSDQGYCYHRAKATAYDQGLHVPLIVSGPGIQAGLENQALVSHVDLCPTILEALALEAPEGLPGWSLRPWLRGQTDAAWRAVVFAEHNAHGPGDQEFYPIRSAFDGRYHYLKNLRYSKSWTGDPRELLQNPQRVREVAFAGPADAFPGGAWDNHSYEATVRARERFPQQYALLASTFKRPAEELYDLETDPYEMINRVEDPNCADSLDRLREALEAWMADSRDPGTGLRFMPRRKDR